jgi:hypothetical protein
MDYEQKYLKYKQKYLDLQNVLKGGMLFQFPIATTTIGSLVGRQLILPTAILDKLELKWDNPTSDNTYESTVFPNYKFEVTIKNSALYYVKILKKK